MFFPPDLYFVRHGETLANATGKYDAQNLNTFSKKGEMEVATLTHQLLGQPKFDLILVSPSPRALRTIAPYLQATHQVATVWPLLYECSTGRRPKNAHPTAFKFGPKITIPRDIAPLFRLDPNESEFPVSPDYNAGLAQVDASVQEFRARFTRGRILLVGHSGQGGHFIHELTGHWTQLKNATEIHVSSR